MLVAGVMSGTSADGVDVALARIGPRPGGIALELAAHEEFKYPRALRERVLAAMDAKATSVAELARLNWRLGSFYADCVEAARNKHQVTLQLIGMHGQTIFHQAATTRYAGSTIRATWQTGEAAVLRARLGVPVVSDFRPADFAAGGQAAPLVPMLDFHLFRHAREQRVLLNLGGIANMTLLPAGCTLDEVVAFDSGPANMVLDALSQELQGTAYDKGGRLASRGLASEAAVRRLMRDPYFRLPPPKSCGREQFGQAYVARLLKLCAGMPAADVLATAAEITVRTVAEAFHGFLSQAHTTVIAAGGGVRNDFLMRRLAEALAPARLTTTVEMDVPAQAKEALAFALLAWLTWHGLPGNVPTATGAKHAAVLGKVSL